MPENEILKNIEADVKPVYKKIKAWTHGYTHVEHVVEAAKKIAQMEGENQFLCQIAAYCHDLGRLEEEEKNMVNPVPGTVSHHAEMSIKPTLEILEKYEFKDEDKDQILEAVRIHSTKKYFGKNPIALILQDADRRDGFGIFSILRFAVFNCEISLEEPNDESEMKTLFDEVMDILKKDKAKRDTMIDSIKYSSEWYTKLLNTTSAKDLLKKDWEFNNKVLRDLQAI